MASFVSARNSTALGGGGGGAAEDPDYIAAVEVVNKHDFVIDSAAVARRSHAQGRG